MTDRHLAQVNDARLRRPLDHADTAEFVAGLDEINALAEASPGFVWRLQDDSGNATGIETPGDDPLRIINVSVWESVQALKDFTFAPDHVAYLRRRRDWFEAHDRPHFAMWWIEAGHEPTVEEADARLGHLAEHGPTREAFTFMPTFPPPP